MKQNSNIEDPAFKKMTEVQVDVNRKVNLLYILAGVYDQALEIVQKSLEDSNLDLRGNDKKTLDTISKLTNKLRIQIDKLQRHSVLKLAEDEAIAHEDTIHMFFSVFMAMITRAGVDEFSAHRIYNIYNAINRYKPLLYFKGLDVKDKIAFSSVREDIDKNPAIRIDDQGNILIFIKRTDNGKSYWYQLLQPRTGGIWTLK